MKQPTLEEVKKHFKKALIVESPVGSFDGKIKIKSIRWYDKEKEKYIACDCDNSVGIITLWGYDTGYSKILTYKEKIFSITESQIKEVNEFFLMHNSKESSDKWKEWFPKAFESEVKSLPKDYTGWCKANSNLNEKWLMFFEKGVQKYGFDSYGIWDDGKCFDGGIKKDNYEATEQEVFEALKNEAVKRGFIGNIYVDLSALGFKNNDLLIGNEIKWTGKYLDYGTKGTAIFKDGKWAEIISTITLSEAEQQLGKKIIV